ncbi:hypothetical protein COS61_01065 [Candidatus Wolfebacteria bacterium CG03_land_8_20_14_0_80_40_12]|uniref:Proline--tRNA ligase n=1 Tax=Candidatus Wolfebacteria bacterium CG03_land_8_20_14_0_80_40_12 TaxID=1975069 RepID=A0A2M7B600_9BACT|nr:MAG: hypothetical protein COS61_01065 [Candidatus Wolfebacteria bacterium CG03_land_8_20_14_0_80_40_12]
MLQSRLFTKTKRETSKDEEAINAQLLIRAGFIDKLMAGVYSFLPLGLKTLKKIEEIIRKEMIKIGGQEILMPALQPKSNWKITNRWETYDSLFKFTSFYSKNEYALGPTHEEIISPLAKKFVFSHKDLPLYIFQIQNKFRDEKRTKSGLLRSREFLMKDLYSFHRDEQDLDYYYEKVKAAYFRIFNQVGIGRLTYLTFASGGSFSKYSHEFQTITSAGEDKIYLCGKCKVAVNQEIIDEQKVCPQCGGEKLKIEKAIETANIFKLKTRFSEPFNLKYKDEKGKESDVMMGCYGLGPSRLMGAIVEIHHDEKGIIWPESIAPFKVHLLNLTNLSGKRQTTSDKIYNSLQKNNIEVLYDDRQDVSAGEKFADADLIGIPYRAVISEKTGGKIELKKRNEKKTRLIGEKELLKFLKQ